jgi:pimeloyl-ACP methyl ester carboxylesterase
VLDRDPGRFGRVIYVDAGPLRDGMALRPDATDDLPLPSWDELRAEQSSTEGMDDEALATFRARAVAHPRGVAASPIHLHHEARLDVPVTVICTSLPSAVLGQMIEAGQMPTELPSVRDVRFVDLPTGHWPMFSRPADLADLLAAEILT